MAVGGVTKPAVRSVWAVSAAASSIADPGDAFAAIGWPLSATPPARQFFNWLENFTFNGVRYQCARGIPDWDATEVCYSIGSVVISDDGVLRVALQNGPNAQTPGTNQNQTPSTASAYWGSPKVPNLAPTDDSTNAANTAYVTTAVNGEAAARTTAINAEATARANAISAEQTARAAGDANTLASAEGYTNSKVAPLAPLNSPTFTGAPTAPNPAATDNSQDLATTHYVRDSVGGVQCVILTSTGATITTSATAAVTFSGLTGGGSYMLEAWLGIQSNGASSISFMEVVPNTSSITPLGQQFQLSAQGQNNLFQPYQFGGASSNPGIPISGANPSTGNFRAVFTMPAAGTSITFEMAANAASFTLLAGTVFRLTRGK